MTSAEAPELGVGTYWAPDRRLAEIYGRWRHSVDDTPLALFRHTVDPEAPVMDLRPPYPEVNASDEPHCWAEAARTMGRRWLIGRRGPIEGRLYDEWVRCGDEPPGIERVR